MYSAPPEQPEPATGAVRPWAHYAVLFGLACAFFFVFVLAGFALARFVFYVFDEHWPIVAALSIVFGLGVVVVEAVSERRG